MMRWVFFSVAVIAIAAVATVGATYWAPDESPTDRVPTAQSSAVPTGPVGAVAVVGGKTTFDFGIMAQATEGKHEWSIVNNGSGPVKLSNGGETCSCTNGSIPKGETVTVEPGASFPMTVTWNTKTWHHFHQIATVIVANDPATPKIEFVIDGEAKPAVVTMPTPDMKIEFQTVGNDRAHSNKIGVSSFDRPETKITGVRANADLFTTEVAPMTAEECKQMKVEHGSKVVITVKPGAPIGPFLEELLIQTDHPNKPEIKFQVTGKVDGPIRFAPDRIRIFAPAKEGGEQTLALWVQGQKETKFTVAKKPGDLDVRIAPMASVGEATQYKFTVTVPPGLPPGTHYEEPIILKTDHPRATEVKVPVMVILRAS
jgi:uncharacterized cupredoxin-like copper-binding protein